MDEYLTKPFTAADLWAAIDRVVQRRPQENTCTSSTSARARSARSIPPPRRAPSPSAKFSRDGTGVYLISNRDGEYARLRFVNLFTAEKSDLSGRADGDVEQFALSKDGHYLAYVTDEGGADKLNLVDLRAHQDLVAAAIAAAPGVVDSLSFDRRQQAPRCSA